MSGEDTNDKSNKSESYGNEWMVRTCDVYEAEYKECRSIRGRFHQYFIYGKTVDCTQWKHDVENCYKWAEKKDIKARNELIKSEMSRRLERLRGHYENDVWTKRKTPPEDWNKPLPEHLQKEYENTYLNIKSKEMKGEISPIMNESFCVIL